MFTNDFILSCKYLSIVLMARGPVICSVQLLRKFVTVIF